MAQFVLRHLEVVGADKGDKEGMDVSFSRVGVRRQIPGQPVK